MEKLTQVQLSKHFYMRDFLYSSVASAYGLSNMPDYPDIALYTGQKLCEEILEPLIDMLGPICIGSAYRSPEVNALCHQKKHNCAGNKRNYGRHIWDYPDSDGKHGAMCIVEVISYRNEYGRTKDFRPLAQKIHEALPYNEMVFFPRNCRFNIGWKEGNPDKIVKSYIAPWLGCFEPKGY